MQKKSHLPTLPLKMAANAATRETSDCFQAAPLACMASKMWLSSTSGDHMTWDSIHGRVVSWVSCKVNHRKTIGNHRKWWFHGISSWFFMGFSRIYPLVNVDRTMEHHHFFWENSLFLVNKHVQKELERSTMLLLAKLTIRQWPFLIAMLNYQRVSVQCLCEWE